MRFVFAIVVLIAISSGGEVQAETTDDAGLWLLVLGQGSFSGAESSKLRWWVDVQVRFSDDASGFNQGIVRPGIGFATGERATLWLGYAWIRNSPAVGDDFDEHRIWQQFTWSAPPKAVNLSSRTRLEQRFRNDGNDTGWRLRQFFKLVYPLPDKPKVSLVAYDELFFGLNDTDWGVESGFDRNRLFLGAGWKVGRGKTFELGYLNQFVSRQSVPDLMDHILSLNLFLDY